MRGRRAAGAQSLISLLDMYASAAERGEPRDAAVESEFRAYHLTTLLSQHGNFSESRLQFYTSLQVCPLPLPRRAFTAAAHLAPLHAGCSVLPPGSFHALAIYNLFGAPMEIVVINLESNPNALCIGVTAPSCPTFLAMLQHALLRATPGSTLAEGGEVTAAGRAQAMRPEVQTSAAVQLVLRLRTALAGGNWLAFFRAVLGAPYLLACASHSYFRRVRADAMATICAGAPAARAELPTARHHFRPETGFPVAADVETLAHAAVAPTLTPDSPS